MFGWGKKRYRTKKLKEERRRRLIIYAVISFIAFILVLIGIWYGARYERININTIDVVGTRALLKEDITEVARDNLEGSYLWLIPHTNGLLAPKKRIEKTLMDRFKRIEAVVVSVEDFQRLSVTINEREQYALWCGEEFVPKPDFSKGTTTDSGITQCYFMDHNGYVFAKAPNFTGDIFLRYHGELEGPRVGGQFLTPPLYANLDLMLRTLKEERILVPVALRSAGEDIAIHTKEGAEIHFRKDDDLRTIFENIQSVLAEEIISANSLNDIEYIDLRFGNKVFYRPRTQETEEPEGEIPEEEPEEADL